MVVDLYPQSGANDAKKESSQAVAKFSVTDKSSRKKRGRGQHYRATSKSQTINNVYQKREARQTLRHILQLETNPR